MSELSLDQIAGLLKADNAKPKSTRGGGPRKPKDPTEPRDYPTWFRLHTSLGFCDNPECGDPRPRKVEEGNAMVAVVKDDKKMCRYCFLAGWLSDANAA